MTKYKVRISIDEEKFFWVIIENKKVINRYTTREELVKITTKVYYYNETNICDRCREENNITDKSILYPGNARKFEIDKKIICYCERHSGIYRQKLPNSTDNLKKQLADCRTGNLDPNSNNAKGNNFEDLTFIWLGAKRLSVEYDKYSRLPFDHSHIPNGVSIKIGDKLVDLSGKIPQTKGKFYDSVNRYWILSLTNERSKIFDYIILYCVSKDGKYIERIYIVPKIEIINSNYVKIVKNPVHFCPTNRKRYSYIPWYEQYRIIDKETIKMVNEIWQKIINE
jgi:hypothetical protein